MEKRAIELEHTVLNMLIDNHSGGPEERRLKIPQLSVQYGQEAGQALRASCEHFSEWKVLVV